MCVNVLPSVLGVWSPVHLSIVIPPYLLSFFGYQTYIYSPTFRIPWQIYQPQLWNSFRKVFIKRDVLNLIMLQFHSTLLIHLSVLHRKFDNLLPLLQSLTTPSLHLNLSLYMHTYYLGRLEGAVSYQFFLQALHSNT